MFPERCRHIFPPEISSFRFSTSTIKVQPINLLIGHQKKSIRTQEVEKSMCTFEKSNVNAKTSMWKSLRSETKFSWPGLIASTASSCWVRAACNEGPRFRVKWNRAILLVKRHKLDPWPLDEGPRTKSGKSRLNLHDTILEGYQLVQTAKP